MDINFIIAQIFGVLGIAASVLSMQMGTKKGVMFMLLLLLLNLFSALNFLFLGSFSGSYVCFFAVLETVINYLFDKNGKKIPIWLIAIYAVVNIALGALSFNNIIDIVPIICALLYCASICVKNANDTKKIMFGNQVFWFIYDIIVKAYMFAVSNVLTMISFGIAIYRFGQKKKKGAKK